MKILKNIEEYLFDNDYKLNITDKYINIINYDEIVDFSINKITVKCKSHLIIIEGKDLSITKMIDNEVLITGIIININIK